jgi:hypothetical protein
MGLLQMPLFPAALFGLVESGVFEFGLHFRVTRQPHTPKRLRTVPPKARVL